MELGIQYLIIFIRWVLGPGFVLSAVFLYFVPISAKEVSVLYNNNSNILKNSLVLNILSGFANAFIYPSAAALLGHWAPPHDRTLLATIVYAGCGLGIALGQPVAGYISDSSLSIFLLNILYI